MKQVKKTGDVNKICFRVGEAVQFGNNPNIRVGVIHEIKGKGKYKIKTLNSNSVINAEAQGTDIRSYPQNNLPSALQEFAIWG